MGIYLDISIRSRQREDPSHHKLPRTNRGHASHFALPQLPRQLLSPDLTLQLCRAAAKKLSSRGRFAPPPKCKQSHAPCPTMLSPDAHLRRHIALFGYTNYASHDI
ncbi:hypothetical protein OPQ81_005594 [Rhizoctonia solani]|nr:hypothetical protein OPQ81_005594 [Rhizoctonia solani]